MTCATAFYLVENYPLDVGPDFSASVIQVNGRILPGTSRHSWLLVWGGSVSGKRPL